LLIDLHIHSAASDGTLSPRQIMELAAQRNIGVLSITDHDTFEGSKKAIEIQKEYNIEVIPGIEINSIYGDEEIHILGYYIEFNNLKLIRILQSLRNSRNHRISKIVSILNSYKFSITEEEVYGIAQSDSLGDHI
jgi:predicted metal-dependent phosphoesterase TrpH